KKKKKDNNKKKTKIKIKSDKGENGLNVHLRFEESSSNDTKIQHYEHQRAQKQQHEHNPIEFVPYPHSQHNVDDNDPELEFEQVRQTITDNENNSGEKRSELQMTQLKKKTTKRPLQQAPMTDDSNDNDNDSDNDDDNDNDNDNDSDSDNDHQNESYWDEWLHADNRTMDLARQYENDKHNNILLHYRLVLINFHFSTNNDNILKTELNKLREQVIVKRTMQLKPNEMSYMCRFKMMQEPHREMADDTDHPFADIIPSRNDPKDQWTGRYDFDRFVTRTVTTEKELLAPHYDLVQRYAFFYWLNNPSNKYIHI
ncbi:hypothetical protein RFI_12142, partial [Reticulomyxa filosa]